MSPGLHRRPRNRAATWLAVAAGILAAVVLASALLRTFSGGPSGDAPPPVTLPHSAGEQASASQGGTEPPPESEVLLTGGDVTWVDTCGVRLPHSTRHGPQQYDEGQARGFTQAPTGAVLAALHLAVRVSPQAGPDVFVPTLAEQVIGPDAVVFGHQVHSQYEHLREQAAMPYGEPLCPIYGRFAGFRLDSYHEAAASLRLLVEAPGPDGVPQLAAVIVQVSWRDGDWRLIAPPHGDWSRVSSLQPASAAARYTPLMPEG